MSPLRAIMCADDFCTEYDLIMDITFSHVKSNCLTIQQNSSHLLVFSLNVNGGNLP